MDIIINNISLPLTILQKKSQLEKGLKGKTSVSGCYLFILNRNNGDEDDEHSFWMKGTLISLDIVFCDNNQILKIFHNCPPCNHNNCIQYSNPGNVVLEFEGGFCEKNGIVEGDTFQLNTIF